MTLTQGHISKTNFTVHIYSQNPYQDHNFLLPCWILIVFIIIVVHCKRVRHTLTNGHISKVKVIVQTYPKSAFGPQLLSVIVDLDNTVFHTTVTCPSLRVISPMSRSQFTHNRFFPVQNLSQITWTEITFCVIQTILYYSRDHKSCPKDINSHLPPTLTN